MKQFYENDLKRVSTAKIQPNPSNRTIIAYTVYHRYDHEIICTVLHVCLRKLRVSLRRQKASDPWFSITRIISYITHSRQLLHVHIILIQLRNIIIVYLKLQLLLFCYKRLLKCCCFTKTVLNFNDSSLGDACLDIFCHVKRWNLPYTGTMAITRCSRWPLKPLTSIWSQYLLSMLSIDC